MTDDPTPDMGRPPGPAKSEPHAENLATAIRRRFAPLDGIDDLELPPREPGHNPPNFDTADYDLPATQPQKAWLGANWRGLGAVTADEINSEIAAARAETSCHRQEDEP